VEQLFPTIGVNPAARHKTAVASREETLVRATGSVSSANTLTAALRKWQCTLVETRPFEPTHLWRRC